MKRIFSLIATFTLLLTLASCGDDSGSTSGTGTGGSTGGSVSTECTDSSTSSLPTCVRTDMSYE